MHHSSRKNHPIRVENYDELKKLVYKDIQKGANQRDIVQKKFSINGEIIGLNPAKVKEVKEEFEKSDHSKEPIHVRLFKLYKKGASMTDAVIETGCSVDEAKKTHKEFLEFENKVVVDETFVTNMYELATQVTDDEVLTDGDVMVYLSEAVNDALKYKKFSYPCKYCGEPIQFDKTVWPSVRKFLIERGWHHGSCP